MADPLFDAPTHQIGRPDCYHNLTQIEITEAVTGGRLTPGQRANPKTRLGSPVTALPGVGASSPRTCYWDRLGRGQLQV